MSPMKNDIVRFQESPWYVQLWRCRHLLSVPYYTLKRYIKVSLELNRAAPLKHLKLIYSVEVGTAHMLMEWCYTSDEVFENLRKQINEKADDSNS